MPLRKSIIVIIALGAGALHFVTGPDYRGPFPRFVNGRLIDIVLPFAMVLLLGCVRSGPLRSLLVRCILVFLVGAVSETLQYLGVPLLGRTFDPLDYLMFALGVAAAALFERRVLPGEPHGTCVNRDHSGRIG